MEILGNLMKTKPNDGINPDGHRNFGLTKREHFAALAMQGMLANSFNDGATQPLSTASNLKIARMAVAQADTLIKALNEEEDENDI